MDLPVRLTTDWVVLAARPGRRLPALDEFARVAVAPGASPVTGTPLVWTEPGQRAALVAWPREVPAEGAPWHVSPDGVTLVRGQLRRIGQPWMHQGRWASDLAGHRAGAGGQHPLEDHIGFGSVVALDGSGVGVAAADIFGSASLFHGSNADLDAVASRPSLVSSALAGDGRPLRDSRAAAWMALTGFAAGDATGHAGVRRLPVGSVVVFDPARGARVDRREWPWLSEVGRDVHTEADAVDIAEAAIIDQLTAATQLANDRVVLDLTGGKDSRLLLAVVLGHLDIDRFRVTTVGAPDVPDVRIAEDIARHFGFPHHSGVPIQPQPGTFAEKVDRFLAMTDGMFPAFVMRLPYGGRRSEVRLSGLGGESYRFDYREKAWWDTHGDPAAATTQDIAAWMATRMRTNNLGLVEPDVHGELEADLTRLVTEDPSSGTRRSDYFGSYFLRHLNNRISAGLFELDDDHRVMALANMVATRAAYGLGATARRAEVVHQSVIRRNAPDLLTLPLHESTWARASTPPATQQAPPPAVGASHRRRWWRRRRPLGLATPTPTATAAPSATRPAATRPAPARPPDPFKHSAVAALVARPDQQRREFLADALSDSTNPVWDWCRRDRALDALSRLDELSTPQRQQLYGVATAARWLGN